MARRDFRLSDELEARLVVRAGLEDRSVSWCIVRAVEEWLGSEGGPAVDDRGGRDRAGSSPVPAAPRASVVPPPFARATSLVRERVVPVPRRTR